MEANDPYSPPAVGGLKPLGSLAQSARGNELNRAKRILIVIGLLTMIANGLAIKDVNDRNEQITYGVPAVLGALFFLFGLTIKKLPVPITIASLILYVAANLLIYLYVPQIIVTTIFFKVIVAIALARSIKAAFAYEANNRKATMAGGYLE